MARLSPTFTFTENMDITMEELLILLDRMYIDISTAVNQKPDLVQRTTDGLTTDTMLAQGTLNINLNTDKVEMLTNHVDPTTVTWTQLS